MKHKLLIDCSFMEENYQGAIDFYACRLLQGFRNNDFFEVLALVPEGCESIVDKLSGYNVSKIVFNKSIKVTPWVQLDRILGLNSLKKRLDEHGIDTILVPCHFDCRFFFPQRFHQHAIVHDLIQYYTNKKLMRKYKYIAWKIFHRILDNKIPHYISISEKTRDEFKKYEKIDSKVVYNSIPFDFSIREEPVEGVGNNKYILDVNRLQWFKNTETLIRAFCLIKDKIPHSLYLKGYTLNEEGDNYREYLKKLVSELRLAERVIFDHSFRREGEMRYLYSHADLFVSPSLMEGFGWTPIEAAILEVPVLLSDIDVFKEISCGKIPTFNPKSTEELAQKMLSLINNPPSKDYRKELSKFYLERYSLERQINHLSEILLANINQ